MHQLEGQTFTSILTPLLSLERPEPECLTGTEYNFDLRRCVDINECESGTHNCASSQQCVNMYKTFRCDPVCKRGLVSGGVDRRCIGKLTSKV